MDQTTLIIFAFAMLGIAAIWIIGNRRQKARERASLERREVATAMMEGKPEVVEKKP